MSAYSLTLLYDRACPLCQLAMDDLQVRDRHARLSFIDISAPGFDPAPYGVALADMRKSIHALKADGSLIQGMEVVRLAYAAAGLGWLVAPSAWPVLQTVLDRVYASLARNRYLVSGRFAWLLNGIAAYRALRGMPACSNGQCTR